MNPCLVGFIPVDTLIMPSRFEPCGISQLLAMRYGCIPIVRNTGGLVDTVSYHDPMNNTGTGYGFDRYEPMDFLTAMIRAAEGYRYKDKWRALQQRGMQKNFSWERSAAEYIKVYQEISGVTETEEEELSTKSPKTSGATV